MTTEIKTISVPFHGNDLLLVEVGGDPFTPMKPLVEGMGLDWRSQQRKLASIQERWGMVIMTIPSQSGDQETLCMPLRKLPGWLMTIHPTRVKSEIREKILQYQNECDDVLWEYWTNGHATNPRISTVTIPPPSEPLDRTLERDRLRLEMMRLRTDRAMKLKKMILEFREREIFGLAEARKGALDAVRLLTGEDPSGPVSGAGEPVLEEKYPALFADVCRALAQEQEPTELPSLFLMMGRGDSKLERWLLDRGILPTSRTLGVCNRISDKVFHISGEIHDRILEAERRIPSREETFEEAVKQFLDGREG
jgi:hypothetical protein